MSGERRRTVEVEIGGRTYRVVTSADEQELRELAGLVNETLREVARGRGSSLEGMVLATLSLAHEARAERQRAERVMRAAKQALGRILERVDEAIGSSAEEPEESPT